VESSAVSLEVITDMYTFCADQDVDYRLMTFFDLCLIMILLVN